MAIRSISIGSMKDWHLYDDADYAYDIKEEGSNAVRLPTTFINGRLDVLESHSHRYINADQIVANTDDWDLETMLGAPYSNVRIDSDAAWDLTGIVAMVGDGMMLRLTNVGSFNITIKHESASSSAVNRFLNNGSVDLVLAPTDSVLYIYDSTNQRWRHTLSISSTVTSAPIGAQFLTLATDGTLTNERVLTPGTGLSGTDAGAGSTYTLDAIRTVTRTTSATYNVTASDEDIFANTDSTSITLNLQAGSANRRHRIVNTGTSGNTVSVTPNGAENLLGANSAFTLNDGESLIIQYNSTDGWY